METHAVAALIGAIAILAFAVLFDLTPIDVQRDTRFKCEQEAIQHHAAEWYVDEDGERQFRWLEPAQPDEEPRVR